MYRKYWPDRLHQGMCRALTVLLAPLPPQPPSNSHPSALRANQTLPLLSPHIPGSSLTLAAPALCQQRDEGAEQYTTNNLSKDHLRTSPGPFNKEGQEEYNNWFLFPLLTLYSVLPSSLHFITFSFISISVSFPFSPLGPLGGTWRVKANTGRKKWKKVEERRGGGGWRKRDGRGREERCTPQRSKAWSHCEDCTIEYCRKYAQTTPPPPPRPTDNVAGRGHQG